jgi:hypothetical protein
MGKTLREKIISYSRDLALAAGLAGALAATGCEALFGSLLSSTAPYSKDPKAGQAAYILGQGIQGNQNARDGRSEVNVNVGNQNNDTQNRDPPIPFEFACKGLSDMWSDNILSYREILGMKTKFLENEQVTFVQRIDIYHDSVIQKLKFKLLDSEGNEIYKDNSPKIGYYWKNVMVAGFGNIPFKAGNYTGVWYVDGDPGTKIDIEILKDKTNTENIYK